MKPNPNLSAKKQSQQKKSIYKSRLNDNSQWDKNEATRSEYLILVEEFKVMKGEISQLLLEARQITNLALTAMGIVLGVVATIIQMNIKIAHEILLALPFFFYFLTCIQLRYIFQALEIHKYLRSTTIPHIQSILLNALPSKKDAIGTILNWERPNRALVPKNILFLPIAGASYGMPFLFSVLLIAIYIYLHPIVHLTINLANTLISLNAIALIYCIGWAMKADRER